MSQYSIFGHNPFRQPQQVDEVFGLSHREKAVKAFVGQMAGEHDEWRKDFHKRSPDEANKPRMRKRLDPKTKKMVDVDVNKPGAEFVRHPAVAHDYKKAGEAAHDAVMKHRDKKGAVDVEAAASHVHDAWIERNKHDPNQNKDLFKPYHELPDHEKEKDRQHVRRMMGIISDHNAR